jgi:glutathione reductase (NADPH)
MVIVGGGYIAVEFAGIMHGLGVDVTIFERGPKVLRGFDEDIRDFLITEMTKKGITFMFNTRVDKVDLQCEGLTVHTTNGETIATDLVMYATGRKNM